MNLKSSLLVLAGLVGLSANAQTQHTSTDAPAHTVAFTHKPGTNYFVSLAGGAAAMFKGENRSTPYKDRLSFAAALSLGKWHTPYYANRLKLVGGETYTFHPAPGSYRNDNYYVGGHYDFMFDVVNYFSSYREDRLFHLIPYVGLGYEYKFHNSVKGMPNVHALTGNAGIQLAFHVAKRVDIFLEGEATYNNLALRSNYPADQLYNSRRLTALAGLTFHIGRQGFAPVEPLDQNYIDGLQGQISKLRAENAELAKRPESCPDLELAQPAAPAADRFVTDKSILFEQGKAVVSKDQLITVFDASEFAKNEGEIVVTGYVAKNESRFKGLAEKRARAVAQLLTDKYGVSSDKITVEWKEAGEAPYSAAELGWNRVVVIRSK